MATGHGRMNQQQTWQHVSSESELNSLGWKQLFMLCIDGWPNSYNEAGSTFFCQVAWLERCLRSTTEWMKLIRIKINLVMQKKNRQHRSSFCFAMSMVKEVFERRCIHQMLSTPVNVYPSQRLPQSISTSLIYIRYRSLIGHVWPVRSSWCFQTAFRQYRTAASSDPANGRNFHNIELEKSRSDL